MPARLGPLVRIVSINYRFILKRYSYFLKAWMAVRYRAWRRGI